MRIEVTYNSEQFIQACFGEGIESAKEYVKAHPKDKYGADDFAEVYRMQEIKQKAWVLSPLWISFALFVGFVFFIFGRRK